MSAHPAGHSYENDPTLYLFTSLTAGSSHIITATSRLETILKANRVPFSAIDTATDEKARRIWVRRAAGRKLPGMVREGMVLADLDQVEEWNEYGELKERLGPSAATSHSASNPTDTSKQPSAAFEAASMSGADASSTTTNPVTTMQQSGREAAAKARSDADGATASSSKPSTGSILAEDRATWPETASSSVETKKQSIRIAENRHKLDNARKGSPAPTSFGPVTKTTKIGDVEKKVMGDLGVTGGKAGGKQERDDGGEEATRTQVQDAKDGDAATTSVVD